MLKTLRLSNFKAFAEAQQLPLRPLTLIFGANSAGKSSLIHGLILAHEANRSGALDVHRTELGGESVDLGGFRQYVHRREAIRRVEWAAELDVAYLTGRLAELLTPVQRVGVSLNIGLELDDKGEPMASVSPAVTAYEITADGSSLLRASRRPAGYLQIDRLEHEHSVFREVIKAIVQTATTAETLSPADYEGLDEAIAELVPELAIDLGNFLPMGLRKSPRSGVDDAQQSMLFPISKGNRKEDLTAAVRFFLPRMIDELIRGLSETVLAQLSRLHYLGPLRSYPPRHLAFAQHHDPNWLAGGGYAWDVVRQNENVRKLVNDWLGAKDRLQTPYRIQIRKLYDIEDLHEPLVDKVYDFDIMKREILLNDIKELLENRDIDEKQQKEIIDELLTRHQDLGAGQETIKTFDDFEELENILLSVSKGIESIPELSLVDIRTGTKVSHRDIGIGISQVLPVLVSAYGQENKIIAIEQPEIHLHPALQAELGDVFIESALGEQRNTFILETHSEHLILRILRRIRETTEGDLPKGLVPIKPEDVQVVYAEPTTKGTVLHNLPVSAEGEFLEKWPDGFFAERAEELF